MKKLDKKMKYFISCDWGTSRLRLRLVKSDDLKIIGEVISMDGIAKTFDNWQDNTEEIDRTCFFFNVIFLLLLKLEKITKLPSKGIPILCSGMATSSIGMKELPYSNIPFSIDGSDLIVEKINIGLNNQNDFWLASGLKTENDVMRGEETEIIGIVKILSKLPDSYKIVLPGTHSKHVQIKNNKITGFETFMTGELFELLKTKSTLRHSIELTGQIHWDSFLKGVELAENQILLKSLFLVRTNHLLKGLDKTENYDFLSGLIIGSELKDLKNQNQKIVLYAKGKILELYQKALQKLGVSNDLEIVKPEDYDKMILAGQLEIFKSKVKKDTIGS